MIDSLHGCIFTHLLRFTPLLRYVLRSFVLPLRSLFIYISTHVLTGSRVGSPLRSLRCCSLSLLDSHSSYGWLCVCVTFPVSFVVPSHTHTVAADACFAPRAHCTLCASRFYSTTVCLCRMHMPATRFTHRLVGLGSYHGAVCGAHYYARVWTLPPFCPAQFGSLAHTHLHARALRSLPYFYVLPVPRTPLRYAYHAHAPRALYHHTCPHHAHTHWLVPSFVLCVPPAPHTHAHRTRSFATPPPPLRFFTGSHARALRFARTVYTTTHAHARTRTRCAHAHTRLPPLTLVTLHVALPHLRFPFIYTFTFTYTHYTTFTTPPHHVYCYCWLVGWTLVRLVGWVLAPSPPPHTFVCLLHTFSLFPAFHTHTPLHAFTPLPLPFYTFGYYFVTLTLTLFYVYFTTPTQFSWLG